MVLSSQTSSLVTSPQLAKKYAPIFSKSGFEAIDFGFCNIYTGTDIFKKQKCDIFDLPHDEMIAYFKSIADILKENKIEVGQTHAPYPSKVIRLGSDEFDQTNEYIKETILKSIEITAAMGCRYIVVHPVFMGYNAQYSWEQERKDNIEFYSSLIETLKKHDVICCLENMWGVCKGKIYGSVCSNVIDACEYIDKLNEIAGEERFGFCFDPGHATLCSDDPIRFINKLGERLKTVHLHDVDVNEDSHTCPFLGVSDWDGILRALSDIGYNGTLNFEASGAWNQYPEEVYGEAIALLGAIGKHFINKYF